MTKAEAIEMCTLHVAREEHRRMIDMAEHLRIMLEATNEKARRQIQSELDVVEIARDAWRDARRALGDSNAE